MPELITVLTEADLKRGQSAAPADLTPYMDIIDTLREQDGIGGVLRLDEDESQRTVKRRMSIAAKARGYQLTWRKALAGQLRFVLVEPGQPRPGGRLRRTRAERAAEQTAVEAIMTEDVAEVTGTTAVAEEPAAEEPATSAPPAGSAPRRGRGRRPAGEASP